MRGRRKTQEEINYEAEQFSAAYIENERMFMVKYAQTSGHGFLEIIRESALLNIQSVALAAAFGAITVEDILVHLDEDLKAVAAVTQDMAAGFKGPVATATFSPDKPQPMTAEDEAIAVELDKLKGSE